MIVIVLVTSTCSLVRWHHDRVLSLVLAFDFASSKRNLERVKLRKEVVLEEEFRALIEARHHQVHVTESWLTPAGNQRSSPLYSSSITNAYLAKSREIKGRTVHEVRQKVNGCLEKWNEQEIRKRVSEAKKNSKEQAQAEAERRDDDVQSVLAELAAILSTTLEVDDKIDWESERDTRLCDPFRFQGPPVQPAAVHAVIPVKPGLTWLLKGRLRRWEAECEAGVQKQALVNGQRLEGWRESVLAYENAKAAAFRQYEINEAKFVAAQARFNAALADFRTRFEAGQPHAVREYCEQVFERSVYPEAIPVEHQVEFDAETGYVVVTLDLPSQDEVPHVIGYKFVARGNKVVPVSMKKKDVEQLHCSVVDQVIVRTIHEVFEGCYIDVVKGAVVTAWTTDLNRATGIERRTQIRGISSDRAMFERFDLSRIDPSACVIKLSENMSSMSGAPQ